MSTKFLNLTGLQRVVNKVKALIPTKTSDLTNDSGYGTYSKPSGGIPKTDLASAVQTSLGKADTALQSSAITNMEVTTNKVTSISSSSTDTQYPSAKLLYDQLALKANSSDLSGKVDKAGDTMTGALVIGTLASGATTGTYAFAQGDLNKASGNYSHAEGSSSATARYAHSEGEGTLASGQGSHAEGADCTASGEDAHAEGVESIASGTGSHAEGKSSASGNYSHAEGNASTSSGATYAHAEGKGNASAQYSHAEGYNTSASGKYSHAEGLQCTANTKSQHVAGEYNVLDSGSTAERGSFAHIVGNGTGATARSNAHTLAWDGTAWFAGDVYTGSTSGTNKDAGSKKLATEDYVSTNYQSKVTYSTTDLTPGTSALTTGELYFVYE